MIYTGIVFLHSAFELEQRRRTWSSMMAPLLEAAYAALFTLGVFKDKQDATSCVAGCGSLNLQSHIHSRSSGTIPSWAKRTRLAS